MSSDVTFDIETIGDKMRLINHYPIKRIIDSFILLTSILSGVASIMWCRSYMVGDTWRICNTAHIFGIESANGLVSVGSVSYLDDSHPHISPRLTFHDSIESSKMTIAPLAPASWLEKRGFYAGSSDSNPRVSWVLTPYWFLTLLLVAPLSVRIGVSICWNNFNTSAGFKCQACGYNLCATRARCPECGAVPKAQVAA
jgi:hypothetical protein